LQTIEAEHGRVRGTQRWGPRTLDLDLLLYDELELQSERLTLPHPAIPQREFVLYPLLEVAGGNLRIPRLGALQRLVAGCPRRGLERLEGNAPD
jgi:2-amino-4-hydroxy-6-hydroxymethyldihydropteridine diphosphokinase